MRRSKRLTIRSVSTHLGHAAAPKGKDAPKKAVLISGPPGIGKTSAAKIICKALGFDVMEVNASDARGKVRRMRCARQQTARSHRMRVQAESDVKTGLNGKCANMVKEMVTNCAVSFDGIVKKQALIMDEVDGMSGGDRGGVQDLINSIKVRASALPGTLSPPHPPLRRCPKFRSSASATTAGARSCGRCRTIASNCSSTDPPSSRFATACCRLQSRRG